MAASDPRLKPSDTYKANAATWQFQLDSYESGLAYLGKGYLFQHGKEENTDFKRRQERATPPGFARAVINAYRSLLGRQEIKRSTTNKEFQQFLDVDCDKRGTTFSQFMLERVFPVSQATGMTWVLVDEPKPDATGAPLSKADEQQQRFFPYVVMYLPTQVINWLFDGFGNLQWATIKLGAVMSDASGKMVKTERFRIWTKTEWLDFEKVPNGGAKQIDSGTHNLNAVPLVPVYNERSMLDQNMGLSAINNIAYLNREIFNYASLLQEFMYKQCFNTLAGPAELLPQPDEETGQSTINLGSNNFLPIPAGSVMPSYISPPVDPARFLMESIDTDIARIYQEAGLLDKSATQTAPAESGIAHAYEFHETNTLLAKKAKNLQEAEKAIARLWELWKGESTNVGFEVEYPRDFDLRDATEELNEVERILKLNIQAPTLKRERVRRAIPIILPDLQPETKEVIDTEIEAATFQSQTTQPGGVAQTGFAARLGLPMGVNA